MKRPQFPGERSNQFPMGLSHWHLRPASTLGGDVAEKEVIRMPWYPVRVGIAVPTPLLLSSVLERAGNRPPFLLM